MSTTRARGEGGLEVEDDKKGRIEGEDGRGELVVKDKQLQLLESIDETLKKILFILESKA